MPDGNGLNVLKELKRNKKTDGVIIISAKNSIDDRIEGLNLGADDYLPKPFHLSELSARILIRTELFLKMQLQNIFRQMKQIFLIVMILFMPT